MSSEEECDYMSEKILNDSVTQDIRPGLIFNRSQKRHHEMLKKRLVTNEENKKRFRSTGQVETERREEGLSQALDSSNKGFALLQKMGYKPGSAIGKTGEGRVDPIGIQVKADRHGLGREAALKEVAARKSDLRRQILKRREQLTNIDSYRSRLVQQQADKLMECDLYKSQKSCQQLDSSKNIDTPSEIWFWPEITTVDSEEEHSNDNNLEQGKGEIESDDEEDLEVEFQTREKLEILTLYLRKVHLYCIWCGTQFEDENDLSENCPGSTRDDH